MAITVDHPPGVSAPPGPRTRLARWRSLPALTPRQEPDAVSDDQRLLIAGIGSLALLGVSVLVVGNLHGAAATWVWVCLQVLPGAAVCVWVPALPRVAFGLYSLVGSMVLNVLAGSAMARTGAWFPTGMQAVVLIACFVSFAAVASRLSSGGARLAAVSRAGVGPHRGLIWAGCAVALVLIAAGTPPGVTPVRAGLVGLVGVLWWAGMACLVAVFGYAVGRRCSWTVPVAAASIAVIVAQAIAYRSPVVTASAAHIGVIDYILERGRVDPTLDIYQAWAGFFASQAWTGAQLGNWFVLATWWPVFGTLTEVLAVRVLAGRFIDPGRAWLAAGVCTLADSLNIAYFSPQVYVFAPALTIPILLLHRPEGRRRATLRWVALALVSLAVIVTHQLTPYIVVCALVMLVLMRAVRPWWAPVALLAAAALWALANRSVLGNYVSLAVFGDVFGNLSPPDHGTPVLPPQRITDLTFGLPALTAAFVGLIAVVALLQRRRARQPWVLAAAAVSSVGVALGTDYGAEGIFRVLLFAMPWLSILAVTVRLPARRRVGPGRRLLAGAVAATLAAALLAVNLLGQSGMDWARTVRPGTIAVEAYFEQHAPDNAVLFSSGSGRVTPGRQTVRYADFQFLSRDDLAGPGSSGFPTTTGAAYDPATDIRDWTDEVLSIPASAHYVLFSGEIGAAGERYRNQSYADYLRMWRAMGADPGWQLVTRSDSAALYRWVGGRR